MLYKHNKYSLFYSLKIEAEASEIFDLTGNSMIDEYVLKNNRLAFNNIVFIEEI